MRTGRAGGGELWVGDMLYSLDAGNGCYAASSNMTFGILRPGWLQGTAFATTNYLLRQPVPGQNGGAGNDTLALSCPTLWG